MQKVEILGVKIDVITMPEAVTHLEKLLNSEGQFYFCTPNPEIILHAQEDEDYKKILNAADLQTADGAGLLWAAEYLANKKLGEKMKSLAKILRPLKCTKIIPARVTGVELTEEICKLSIKSGQKIFLLGAGTGVAAKAQEALEKKYPGLKIVGTFVGSPHDKEAEAIITMVNDSGAEILLVAYGAPAQEKWIAQHLKKMPQVKLAGGIGGTFDFLAGTKKRAPEWMQKSGIEWLYRLIREPKRIKRIWNATVKFPTKILKG